MSPPPRREEAAAMTTMERIAAGAAVGADGRHLRTPSRRENCRLYAAVTR